MAEGTVYYKNSPALESVQGAVSASFSDVLLKGARDLEEEHAVVPAADALQDSSLWKRLLSIAWRDEDSNFTCHQVDQAVSAVLQSGLLNEEHHHLVATVMRASKESELDDERKSSGRSPEAPPPSLADELEGVSTPDSVKEQPLAPSGPTPSLKCQGPQSALAESTRPALLLSSPVAVVFFLFWWAPSVLLSFTFLLFAASAATSLCVYIWRYRRRRAVERGVAEVMRYVEDFDGLLCLVAESIRYLQEMEALSKGYARSSVIGGHFYQVGGAGVGVSHCVVLRRTFRQVVSALSAGIHTCAPLDDTSPVEPAANVADDLSHLLGEEGLGLVELKEQCHMLAVGNSRMLRDLCLALKGSPLEGVPERTTDPLLLLCTLSSSLNGLTLAVERGSQRLKRALKFEELYCSEPEGCVKGLFRGGGCGPSPSPSPLAESLLRGLRGMDLKGQLVVRGIRDCVRLLKADSSQLDSLPQVETHLLAMQTHLSALSTDLTDAVELLQPQDSTATEHSADSDCPSDREETESSQPRKTVSPDQSPLSSDEEKVYEAYVSKRHDSEEEWPTGGEDPEYPRGQSDLPVKMVNELKNVLSLRELQRMERRALRRRRRGGSDKRADRQPDGKTDGHTDTPTDRHTVQHTMSSSQLPPSSGSPVNSPSVTEETAVPNPAYSSLFPSDELAPGNLLGDEPVVGVSAPPTLVTAEHAGEGLPKLQAVSSLVALLARQQRAPQKEECFGDSSGSEEAV